MTGVPAAAIEAAAPVVRRLCQPGGLANTDAPDEVDRAAARQILEAAGPHLAAERDAELAAARQRTAALEQLAAHILSTFGKTDAGYRARVGHVQIEKWRKTLDGQQ